MTPVRVLAVAARIAAAGAALSSISRAARRLPPIRPGVAEGISVVIPARDEETRLAPLLDAVAGAPGVAEVLVVDDQSTDGTAALARRRGATVVSGMPSPDGWAGKAWALQQGLEAASGDWVVFLDADTRPSPELPAALVARMVADELDMLTVGGRFDCPTRGLRWLHPALLTTLVYRSPPPGASRPGPARRRMGNGQCIAARRSVLVETGGWRQVAPHTVEDVALVRAMATAGFAVAFLDAGDLLTVRMYESAPEAWSGWGRSLSLPGVESLPRRIVQLGVVALAQTAPLLRLLVRRWDVLDTALLAVRAGTLVGTARAYERRGIAYWLSPTADVVATAAIARSLLSRTQRWRGRTYGPSRSAAR